MLASFGTFLSPLYDIKLFRNLMMAAAAACEVLTDGYLHEFGNTLWRETFLFLLVKDISTVVC